METGRVVKPASETWGPPRVSQAQGALQSSPSSWRAMEESFRELRESSKMRSRETAYVMWRLRSSPSAVYQSAD